MDDMDDQLSRILTTLTVLAAFVGGIVCLGLVGQLIAKRRGSREGFRAGAFRAVGLADRGIA